MIRFIWQNWWRRKERFILLIIGALIVSIGLTYLVGISDVNKGTIVDTLEQRWTASYDIVVRPEGSRSVTEDKNLLEPNYLSGMSGGISIEQYETIKEIAGVEVAAPIAMIGYGDYEVELDTIDITEPALYRLVQEKVTNNGIKEISEPWNMYFPVKYWSNLNKGPEYGVGSPDPILNVSSSFLLAGIDPEQEAKLVGLDEAILTLGNSRYFSEDDTVSYSAVSDVHQFPAILSTHAYVDQDIHFTLEELDVQFGNEEEAEETMEMVKDRGGAKYLDTVPGDLKEQYSYTSEELFKIFFSSIAGVDMETGEPYESEYKALPQAGGEWMPFRPSPVEYSPVESPYMERWPFAYEVNKVYNDGDVFSVYLNTETFREPLGFGTNSDDWPRVHPKWIGFYNPSKLDISQDPANELPMETYRPASADLVLDPQLNPVNPSKTLKPTDDPYGFLTNPPDMLTTIEAAESILGDEPISAIRVKVAGVSELGEESQATLEKVASDIEEATGLITDITLGSSPQLTLTYVPSLNDEEAIGWIQQPWVHIGSAISLFREANLGLTGVLASVIGVAIIYVWATSLVSMFSRRHEFAVLLSIGWRPSQVSKLLFIESMIIGCFVAMISWTMLGLISTFSGTPIELMRFFLTGFSGFAIYSLGAVIPAWLTRNISPYEAMRTGEITSTSARLLKTRGLISMAFNHFMGKWKRSILSVIAIALPTGLLALFLYITFRLQGIMYTTWIGQFVALEVGPVHYTALIVALIIAILTAAEIMWQNIAERQSEIAVLKATGWRNRTVRYLVWLEGICSGLLAAVIGLSFAFLMMWGLYGQFPTEEIGFILATGIVPVIVGWFGSILPAERAVRMMPYQSMDGTYETRKRSEQRMKWVVIGGATIIIISFIGTMVQIAPSIQEAIASYEEQAKQDPNPTEGDVTPTIAKKESKDSGEDDDANDDDVQDEKDRTKEIYGTNVFMVFDSGEEEENRFEYFVVTQIESEQEPADGMKRIAVEFKYENRDEFWNSRINLQHALVILTPEGEKFTHADVNIIDSENWEREREIIGSGHVHAIVEYEIPEDIDDYVLRFRPLDRTQSYIILISDDFEE
ncbi:ABC transporter permease [Lentibacillus sp.]|uniref:ABC transporter permease n=1 Tax=Lentibacillus sp. TaxID=1925746 RepID=UPI002B4B2AEB|nr:FtsX-like permease family protein [Lentibacillus sp.]HLS07433.1 FtsX-like permease family protein [Lentibacillus sp.]